MDTLTMSWIATILAIIALVRCFWRTGVARKLMIAPLVVLAIRLPFLVIAFLTPLYHPVPQERFEDLIIILTLLGLFLMIVLPNRIFK